MDFFSEKELKNQTAHNVDEWPLVILKELIDNALDACEEAHVLPDILVEMTELGELLAHGEQLGLARLLVAAVSLEDAANRREAQSMAREFVLTMQP